MKPHLKIVSESAPERLLFDSRVIAKAFHKRHRTILRDIDGLLDRCSKRHASLRTWLRETPGPADLFGYRDPRLRHYVMTLGGLVLVVGPYRSELSDRILFAYLRLVPDWVIDRAVDKVFGRGLFTNSGPDDEPPHAA
jgi:hypothetical protein